MSPELGETIPGLGVGTPLGAGLIRIPVMAGRTDAPLGTGLVRIPVMAGRTDAPLRICASRCGQTTAAIATSAMASPRRTLEMLARIVL